MEKIQKMADDQARRGDYVIKATIADGLATEIEKSLANDLFMPLECCIFRVPTILSRHNEKAYIPNAFSIGPFHYKTKNPPIMESTQNPSIMESTQNPSIMESTQNPSIMESTQRIKLRYLNGLISRTQPPNSPMNRKKRLREFIDEVSKHLAAARLCYGGQIGISMDEFVKVLVLDGCFIIELFRKNAYERLRDADDPVFKMSCLLQFLNHDLILLENQIPWLLLDILFDMTKITSIDTKPLVQLAIEFFGNIFSTRPPSIQQHIPRLQKSKHILDLMRNSLVCSSTPTPTKQWEPMPSATSLEEAGIKFRSTLSKSILDITFKKGVLEMPSLFIQETTEPIFRNLISLEQCCPGYEPIITSYAILIDNLVNTNKDMDILCKSEVLHNWLNVEDATKFFNQLYNDTYVKENYYQSLTSRVNQYSTHRWPKYRRMLKHDYFNHPWALISFIVAAFVVICTFIQTVYTIIK